MSAELNFECSTDIVIQLLSEIQTHTKIDIRFPINASAEAKNIPNVSHIKDYGNVLLFIFPLKYLIIIHFQFC